MLSEAREASEVEAPTALRLRPFGPEFIPSLSRGQRDKNDRYFRPYLGMLASRKSRRAPAPLSAHRMKTLRAVAVRLTFGLLLGTAAIVPAAAHPLGNFTINHLTRLSFGHDRVTLRYVLDMAEIPTYQVMRAASSSGRMTAAELAAWGGATGRALLPQLQLVVDGAPIDFVAQRIAVRTRSGAGGLRTIYLTLDAGGSIPQSAHARAVIYRDESYPGRLGWRDVVVAPALEPTHELTAYPSTLLGSPRATSAVRVELATDGSAVARATIDQAVSPAGPAPIAISRSNQLSDMLARGTSDWGLVGLTFLVAIMLGALHALEPGHGKTLLAISLVGARATVRQAAVLAAALTIAHTAGVLALGVAINLLKGTFVPESIYPWITLGSGIVIAVIGARAVQRQIAARMPHAHVHDHGHDHVHGHDHDDLAHARLHALPGAAPLKFGPTILAAMSGAVAPCPAALVVLLAAIALNQVAYGIFVIVAFSVGLAVTLTGLGVAVVRGAGWLQRRPQFDRFVTYGPIVSALVIASIGAIMVGQGFAQQGLTGSPAVVTLFTALAIAGYAFAHPFAHHHRIEPA
jgi:ABC-type nickel/cobalt efflux system permease component RcnA